MEAKLEAEMEVPKPVTPVSIKGGFASITLGKGEVFLRAVSNEEGKPVLLLFDMKSPTKMGVFYCDTVLGELTDNAPCICIKVESLPALELLETSVKKMREILEASNGIIVEPPFEEEEVDG